MLLMVATTACGREPRPAAAESPRTDEARQGSFVSALTPDDARMLRFRLRAPDTHPLYLENPLTGSITVTGRIEESDYAPGVHAVAFDGFELQIEGVS